jgi:hypothetical protein
LRKIKREGGEYSMGFDAVKSAIADVESSENAYESAVSSNNTAQKALVDASATARSTADSLAASGTDLTARLETLKQAISDFEKSLSPTTT